jgi:glycosyl transferase family 87
VVAPLVVVALTIIYQRRIGDYAGYLVVGELGLRGGDIYRDAPPGINTWPPLFGLACIPLAWLSRISVTGARVFWMLVGWGALLVALACATRLVQGRRLVLPGVTGSDGVDITTAAALLPLLLSIRWILANFEHLQVNIVILALTLLGLVCHRARRDARAGILIGLAAALKLMPVLFVPYFFWRRQWRAFGWTLAAVAGWTLLPALVYGPARYASQFRNWLDFFHRGQGVGKMNASVFAMLDRIAGHHLVPFSIAGFDDLAPSGSTAVRLLLLGLMLLVTCAACWLFRGPYDPARRSAVAEWSIVLLVGVIFSPLTWKFYLVVLLLPMTLFVATWQDSAVALRFRRRLRWLTWLGFALGFSAAEILVGPSLAWRMEMGSMLTFMALLILGTLYWYRDRIDQVAA